MGMERLESICARLVASDATPHAGPSSIARSLSGQRIVRAPLAELADAARTRAWVHPPSDHGNAVDVLPALE
jgi:hypothetical protein